jgi:hypothetical protein
MHGCAISELLYNRHPDLRICEVSEISFPVSPFFPTIPCRTIDHKGAAKFTVYRFVGAREEGMRWPLKNCRRRRRSSYY